MTFTLTRQNLVSVTKKNAIITNSTEFILIFAVVRLGLRHSRFIDDDDVGDLTRVINEGDVGGVVGNVIDNVNVVFSANRGVDSRVSAVNSGHFEIEIQTDLNCCCCCCCLDESFFMRSVIDSPSVRIKEEF